MEQKPASEVVVTVKFHGTESGFCRTYYKGTGKFKGRLYCLQDMGLPFGDRMQWLICTPDGEPEGPLREGITLHVLDTGKKYVLGEEAMHPADDMEAAKH